MPNTYNNIPEPPAGSHLFFQAKVAQWQRQKQQLVERKLAIERVNQQKKEKQVQQKEEKQRQQSLRKRESKRQDIQKRMQERKVAPSIITHAKSGASLDDLTASNQFLVSAGHNKSPRPNKPANRSPSPKPLYKVLAANSALAEKRLAQQRQQMMNDLRRAKMVDLQAIRNHEKLYIERVKDRLKAGGLIKSSHKIGQDGDAVGSHQPFTLLLNRDSKSTKSLSNKLVKRRAYDNETRAKIPVTVDMGKRLQLEIQIDKQRHPKKYLLMGKVLSDEQIYNEFQQIDMEMDPKRIGQDYLHEGRLKGKKGSESERATFIRKHSNQSILKNGPTSAVGSERLAKDSLRNEEYVRSSSLPPIKPQYTKKLLSTKSTPLIGKHIK